MSWFPFNWWSSNTPPVPKIVPSTIKYRDTRPECVTNLTASQQVDLSNFLACYKNNIFTYTTVGQAANIPPMLVAAIHWREASGDFSSYLEQGDPIGSITYTNGDSNDGHSLPPGTPNTISFNNWVDGAIWALNQNIEGMRVSGLSFKETDINDMCTYSEYYNGTGYMRRGIPSPYVFSGTSCYIKGKFTSDGEFDSSAVDTQLGVLVMLRAIINA